MTSRYPGYDALAHEIESTSGPIRPLLVVPGVGRGRAVPSDGSGYCQTVRINLAGDPEPYYRRAETTHIYIYVLFHVFYIKSY